MCVVGRALLPVEDRDGQECPSYEGKALSDGGSCVIFWPEQVSGPTVAFQHLGDPIGYKLDLVFLKHPNRDLQILFFRDYLNRRFALRKLGDGLLWADSNLLLIPANAQMGGVVGDFWDVGFGFDA